MIPAQETPAVYVQVSRELLAIMEADWSPLVQCKIEREAVTDQAGVSVLELTFRRIDILADLADRTEKAAVELQARARELRRKSPRLEAKREGVLLVLSYINEIRKGMQ